MRKCFSILIILLLMITGCTKENSNKNDASKFEAENYSIIVVPESMADSLKNSAREIQIKFQLPVFLNQTSDTLLVGDFKSEINAWYFAELFLRDSIISNYRISYKNKIVESNVDKMLFVSGYLNRPSLFEFDFNTLKTKMIWSQWGRKIIRLYPAEDMQKFFLTTGLTLGRSGGFPFITEARLYQYTRKDNEVHRVNIFGEGTQYSAGWHSADTFKTSFITVDSFKTSTIIDHEMFFDLNGNAIDTVETVYDIIKDGYPHLEKDTLQVNSASGAYHIQARAEAERYVVSAFKEMSEFMGIVDTIDHSIHKIVWSKDENYVAICSGVYKKNSLTGEFDIHIFSLKDKTLIYKLSSQLLRDVVFYGPYLLLDDLDKNKQVIKVYDCYKNEMLTTISLNKESGIYSIPIKMSRVKSENLF